MKKKPQKESPAAMIKHLLAQPPADFYRQPMLHINCKGQVQVENCRSVLEYTKEKLRLDMGKWEVEICGSDLILCGVGTGMLELKGRIFKAELFYQGEGQL